MRRTGPESGLPTIAGPLAIVVCISSTTSMTRVVASIARRLASRRSSACLRIFFAIFSSYSGAQPPRGCVFFDAELAEIGGERHANAAADEMKEIANELRDVFRRTGVDAPASAELFASVDAQAKR